VTSLMDIQNVNVSVERVSEKCHLNSATGQSSISKSTNSTVFLQHTTQQQFSTSSTTTKTPLQPGGYAANANNNGNGGMEAQQNQHHHHHQPVNGNFYQQETLDMSDVDIQRTLQANMSQDPAVDLEPMSPSVDEVFGNLDTFDILGDLADDLEHLPHGERNAIVDINPEWAYSEVRLNLSHP